MAVIFNRQFKDLALPGCNEPRKYKTGAELKAACEKSKEIRELRGQTEGRFESARTKVRALFRKDSHWKSGAAPSISATFGIALAGCHVL